MSTYYQKGMDLINVDGSRENCEKYLGGCIIVLLQLGPHLFNNGIQVVVGFIVVFSRLCTGVDYMQAVAKLTAHFGAANCVQGAFPHSIFEFNDVLEEGRDDVDQLPC